MATDEERDLQRSKQKPETADAGQRRATGRNRGFGALVAPRGPDPSEGYDDQGRDPGWDCLTRLAPGGLALLGNGQFAALAHDDTVAVIRFQDVLDPPEGGRKPPEPLVRFDLPAAVVRLEARGPRKPFSLVAALENGSVWGLRLSRQSPDRGRRPASLSIDPGQTLLTESIEGSVRGLFITRSRILLLTRSREAGKHTLHEIDHRSRRVARSADLPFTGLTSLAPLEATRSDVLVAVDAAGDGHLVSFPDRTVSRELTVTGFEGVPRMSAATVLAGYLVVASKGGELQKVAYTPRGTSARAHHDALARACRLLRALLEACGCACEPHAEEPEPGTPGADLPGGHVDDEPCEEKHRAWLQWTPEMLRVARTYLVAYSARGDRMAVLDRQLNVVFERYLGRRGTRLAFAGSSSDRMLIHRPGGELEAWSLTEYARHVRALDPAVLEPQLPFDSSPTAADSVTYYGQRHGASLPNPHLRVAVFTVIEPGQPFTDADQSVFHSQIEPNVFAIVTDYYDEASYGDLDVEFDVFGVDIGGARKPLVLPQPVASYFWDDFTPGGVEAVMPADWADPLVLDGSESLELRTDPRVGDGKDYVVPFAALWTTKTHGAYPVDVDFDGTETLEIQVEDQEGGVHVLSLAFDALALSHDQGDDEGAFLAALGNHVTAAVRDAEAALPGSPLTLQDVVFRRVRTSDDDAEFGRLQGQFRVAPPADPADATQKGKVEITPPPAPAPDGLTALGLAGLGERSGELGGVIETRNYLRECLDAARMDAGEGPGLDEPHFSRNPSLTEDAAAMELTARVNLTAAKGGQGASIEVIDHDNLDGSGWDAAVPVPGSESNANNQNTLRHHRQLADDVFTAALDHIRATSPWGADAVRAMFADYDVMMIGFVGAPPAGLPPSDQWGSVDPTDFARLRMFKRTHFATDQNNPDPDDPPVAMGTNAIIGQKFNTFRPGLMAHELGHALGLPDLYSASGFRDDVLYIDSWAMMGGGNESFNHFCAWSKWVLGWIVEDPADDDLDRVVDVPLPDPSGTSETEAWLVPVEYWDSSMKADVRAVVGGSLPIAQMMKLHLGSDGGIVDLIELRMDGQTYSQNLPGNPALICTNVLQPGTDRRWAVNGLYRRSVHRLNSGNELMNVGDAYDFAAASEFPLKGCTVEVVDIETIRGGSISVFRVKVAREAADYVDLFFQDNVPAWRSPDIWVDWPGDNPDPAVPRIYPEGTPTDQGETVRFPSSGVEPHFLMTRVHNGGTVRGEDVKVRWFICDPPGAGDDGRWVEKDTKTIPEVAPDDWDTAPFTWDVDPSTSVHQCLRAEIIDWTIPAEVDPATGDTLHLASDDVWLQNNNAQQNVFDFEALSGSAFAPVEFLFQVHNDAVEPETAYLVPNRLPWGMTLEISPAEAVIPPGEKVVFRGKLTLDDREIRPGCSNDQGFLLTTWRVAHDADEKWGSCFYHVRPRLRTIVQLQRGFWMADHMSIGGEWKVLSDEQVELADHLPLFVRVRIDLYGVEGHDRTLWRTAAIQPNGLFSLELTGIEGDIPGFANLQAWFDRTDLFGSSVSKLMQIKHVPPIE